MKSSVICWYLCAIYWIGLFCSKWQKTQLTQMKQERKSRGKWRLCKASFKSIFRTQFLSLHLLNPALCWFYSACLPLKETRCWQLPQSSTFSSWNWVNPLERRGSFFQVKFGDLFWLEQYVLLYILEPITVIRGLGDVGHLPPTARAKPKALSKGQEEFPKRESGCCYQKKGGKDAGQIPTVDHKL